jgi:hypothetical protein
MIQGCWSQRAAYNSQYRYANYKTYWTSDQPAYFRDAQCGQR